MTVRELKTYADEVNASIIETLEEALADARAGKLADVVIISNVRGESAFRAWSSKTENRFERVGVLFAYATQLSNSGK